MGAHSGAGSRVEPGLGNCEGSWAACDHHQANLAIRHAGGPTHSMDDDEIEMEEGTVNESDEERNMDEEGEEGSENADEEEQDDEEDEDEDEDEDEEE